MNIISIKNVALGLAFSATVFGAKAQNVITEGQASYSIAVGGQTANATTYFKGDTSSLAFQRGPAQIKMVGTKGGEFFAVFLDVPVASMKKVAIGTPAEIDEAQANEPQYAFTKTEETKKIGDFNCKKYVAKDTRDGSTYDLWITTDVTIPANMITKFYSSLGGTPVLFTFLQNGNVKGAQVVTLTAVTATKVPANMFKVTADYEKMTLTDMQNMGKGRQ
ncbi:hypothetical protein BDD43_5234 [Mucilaginibacter gracilis]|uniref:DUF4412 domain-containing protein n=1 Tax=Mucilaginibacter gracilis TaxID=423350 RepID=A0A495J7L0_9SPHI|nr:hypothetical protein [Mucilaginibacter gracilis]RKR84980.1 hypothetical protein BDD43_5234 [Mucilaginibacter gracilis]